MAGRALLDLELYQSEEDLGWARRLRLARKGRSHLLGNGTDTGHFDPARVPAERAAALRREFGLPADALVVGAVGLGWWSRRATASWFAAARGRPPGRPAGPVPGRRRPDLEKADAITEAELDRAAGDVLVTGWRDDVRDSSRR